MRFIRNMKLIVTSYPTNIDNEHKILCSLFENGLDYFHLRKPEFTSEEMEAYLTQIPSNYLNRVVIHSHYELADKYVLKGKHKTSVIKETSNLERFVSTSFHSLEEINNCTYNYEYAFLSPIFDSISKENYKSNFNKTELKSFFNIYKKEIKIIGLGGVNEHNANEAIELGFNGVAVLGAVWNDKNPVEKLIGLNNIVMLNASLSRQKVKHLL